MRGAIDQQRSAGLDAGRFVAAVAIVWLHTAGIGPAVAPWGAAGRFAVPYFTLLAIALTVDGSARNSSVGLAHFARKRFTRIYLPFLLWTAIYLLFRLAKHALIPGSAQPPVGLHLFLIGSTHHLWYLPFVLLATLAARGVSPVLGDRRLAAAVAGIAGIAVAAFPTSLTHDPYDPEFRNQLNYLLMLGWSATPSAFGGVAVGLYLAALLHQFANRPWVTAGAILLVAALLAPGDEAPLAVFRASLAGVLFLVAMASLPTGRTTKTLARLGQYSLGMYLIHVFYILAIESIVVRDREGFNWMQATVIFAGAVAASVTTTAILSRYQATAWAVT